MLFKVLAVGDVTGESGVDFLHRRLRSLKKEKSIDFVVANGENAAGNGLLPTHAEDILAAGVDVITLGNHSFGKTQIADFLEESPYILRPANFTGRAPGRGWAVYDCGRVQVGVMNLIGRCNLDFNAENPFTTADRILTSPPLLWWIFTPRPPAKSWPCRTIWMAGSAPCGGPTPTYLPPMGESAPRAWAISPTWV